MILISDVAYCDPPEPVTVLMAELRGGSIKKGDKIIVPTTSGPKERTVLRLQHFTQEHDQIDGDAGFENFGIVLDGWGEKNIQTPFEINQ